jgi:capping protein beta
MGRMIEEMENKLRSTIQEIYFGKTKDILNDIRSMTDLTIVKNQNAMQAALLGRLQERNKN